MQQSKQRGGALVSVALCAICKPDRISGSRTTAAQVAPRSFGAWTVLVLAVCDSRVEMGLDIIDED